ncbi:MAG: DUF2007 domain-containing protein [Pseudoflavonifractor sp.]|nr:DUF2007 domain-containing protein [Pseudoflavonifractor sp.]
MDHGNDRQVEGWVLFRTYYSDADAYIDKGVLETNGVPCVILNEIMSTVYPLTLTPLGAIRLMVPAGLLDEARLIIASPPVG